MQPQTFQHLYSHSAAARAANAERGCLHHLTEGSAAQRLLWGRHGGRVRLTVRGEGALACLIQDPSLKG